MEDLAASVKGGDAFDMVISSPDAMRIIRTLGQILGPRGLMPNPKVGTVTPDVATAVKNAKAGQVQFRVDKAGIVHGTIGRRSETPTSCRATWRRWSRRWSRPSRPPARVCTCARWRCRRRWASACASIPRRFRGADREDICRWSLRGAATWWVARHAGGPSKTVGARGSIHKGLIVKRPAQMAIPLQRNCFRNSWSLHEARRGPGRRSH